ncbi:hypothetical protein JC795_08470 [Pseudomonas veronii]|uniref:hypothetical protein n=1 Tax=Pseudomonas veronii TaxID=76761 RepID=UPI0018E874E9|nr:hypothetical protein [Pseudomonas veronii]MBJ2178228.1 hypothetical protein [Pseudomonas veronii]
MNVTGVPTYTTVPSSDVSADVTQTTNNTGSTGNPRNAASATWKNDRSELTYDAERLNSDTQVRSKRGIDFGRFFRRPTHSTSRVPSGTPGKYTPVKGSSFSNPPSAPAPNKPFRDLISNNRFGSTTLPSRSHPVPKTFGEVAQNLVTADRLVKAGVFKTGPDLKTVTRDAFVNAAVNGLVSTPLSIGTYAGSVWSGEQIKGAFSANTPLLPPAHQPAPSQQNGVAGSAPSPSSPQDLALHLDNAELKLLLVSNTIQAYTEGSEGQALDKSPDWPTETTARLDMLEKQYNTVESNLELISKENDFIFRPFKSDTAATEKDPVRRLETLDRRNQAVLNQISRINTVLEPKGSPSSMQFV